MAERLLVFQHVPHESPGLILRAAAKRGIELDVMKMWLPYKMPQVGEHQGLWVLGGPMGANDGPKEFPSRKDEEEYIKEGLGKIRIMGTCLGSQELAVILGGRVYPDVRADGKHKQIGYYQENLTPEGLASPLFRGFSSPMEVFQWHGDVFDLPPGAVLLAQSSDGVNQAFSWGDRTVATLFHNEFTPEMVDRLLRADNAWAHDQFELDEEALRQQSLDKAALMERQCQMLFDNFLALPSLYR